ncbi:hypothetical protein [Brachybacterium sp. GCM10030252]|uniref:hypothetical protein n=1 Tax=Brachybacterium sp. GCM10030252 TaxID=3273380 RepID=UPI003618039F
MLVDLKSTGAAELSPVATDAEKKAFARWRKHLMALGFEPEQGLILRISTADETVRWVDAMVRRRTSLSSGPAAGDPQRRLSTGGARYRPRTLQHMDGNSRNVRYRTCTECGGNCEPEPMPTEVGMRISFICPRHGVHSVIDPFAAHRGKG